MENTKNNQFDNAGLNSQFSERLIEEGQIDFKYLINAIKRRKKIAFVVALTIFIFNTARIIYRKNYHPTYSGSFTLLISDPLSSKSRNEVATDGALYSQIARNVGKGDIPTLIEVLKSPLVLNPIAEKNNISLRYLQNSINIRTGGTGTRDREAKGILKVCPKLFHMAR